LLRKSELCDQVCREIGMTRRKRGHPNLDKRELLQLISWIRVSKQSTEELESSLKIQTEIAGTEAPQE
jgi:hypothetical protein